MLCKTKVVNQEEKKKEETKEKKIPQRQLKGIPQMKEEHLWEDEIKRVSDMFECSERRFQQGVEFDCWISKYIEKLKKKESKKKRKSVNSIDHKKFYTTGKELSE